MAQAKEYFNCDESMLVVNEIKEPSQKLIKLLSTKGIYEIDIKENESESSTKIEEDLDGLIEITNGEIKVIDPKQGGRFPVAIMRSHVAELFVNGNKIEKESELRSEDNIEIKFYNEEPSSKIKVWLSEDKLKAFMKIIKVPGKEYFLQDSKPANRVLLQIGYKEIEPAPPRIEECIEALAKEGVDPRFIKHENIRSLQYKNEGEIIAAEGEPPVHGVDSKIEYLFQNESYRNPDFDTDKKVNLLDHTIIPHVKEGDVLAVKSQLATPGKDGVAVNGALLKAKNGIDLPLKGGSGVAVEGNKIISLINGRPNLKYGVVSVVPTLIISNNVSVETGNINFDGDVVIKGNVEENLCVRVTGNVQISGSVYHAFVHARGNIEIKGQVINSRISAGTNMAKYLCINPWLKQILGIIKAIKDSVNELKNNQTYVNVKYQVRQLVIQHKAQIEFILSEIENRKKFLDSNDTLELDSLLKLIKLTITGINAKCIEDFESIETAKEEIEKYIWCTEKNLLSEGNVVVSYTQNSYIQANGSITILEKGSFHSDIIAREMILFTNPRSIVRGGYLLAGKKIKMKSVGTPSGATTHCKVIDRDGTIEADNFTNVFLDIGGNIQNIE